jgi:hypothetical protein
VIGSSNLTEGGWSRNTEANVLLKIKSNEIQFAKLWNELEPLGSPDLCDAPDEVNEEIESLQQKIIGWISEWSFDWLKLRKQPRHNELPLSIITTPCPSEIWREIKGQKITIRSGNIVSRFSKVPKETVPLDVATRTPFALEDLNPLIEIQVGSTYHWIIPNYESFPARAVFERIHVRDLMEALTLLLRPSAIQRRKRPKRKVRSRGTAAQSAAQVDLEKVVISFFKECHPEKIQDADRRARANEIKEWVERAGNSSETEVHDLLIGALKAIAGVLREKRRVS